MHTAKSHFIWVPDTPTQVLILALRVDPAQQPVMDVCHQHAMYQLVYSCSWEDTLGLLKIVSAALVSRGSTSLCSWFPELHLGRDWGNTEFILRPYCSVCSLLLCGQSQMSTWHSAQEFVFPEVSGMLETDKTPSLSFSKPSTGGITADRAPEYSCAGCSA